MSYQATCWAWNQQTESSGQKLVLLALANACGGDEDDPQICWPSFKRIADETQIGDSTVRTHVKRLTELGLVSKMERRVRANGTLGVWVLTINFLTAAPPARLTADPSAARDRRSTGALEPESKEPEKEISRAFVDFWSGYPRKIAKPAALKAWKKIAEKEHLAVMLGLSLWAQYWQVKKTEPDFIPHPATWLNQKRWEDTPIKTVGQVPVVERVGHHWSERRQIWIADGM